MPELSSSNNKNHSSKEKSTFDQTLFEDPTPVADAPPILAPLLDQTHIDSSQPVYRYPDGPDLDLAASAASTTPPTKRQLRRQRQKKLRLCSFSIAEAERQLLTFNCLVSGFPARVLIDGGAEGNVISTTFQRKNNLQRTTINPIPVLLPDGSSTITNHTVAITIERKGYIDSLDPILYPLS